MEFDFSWKPVALTRGLTVDLPRPWHSRLQPESPRQSHNSTCSWPFRLVPVQACATGPPDAARPVPGSGNFSSLYYPWGNEYTGGGNVNQAFRPNTGDTAQIRTFTMPSSGHCGHFSKRIQRNTPIGLPCLAQISQSACRHTMSVYFENLHNKSQITKPNACTATAAHPLPVQTKVQTHVNESISLQPSLNQPSPNLNSFPYASPISR